MKTVAEVCNFIEKHIRNKPVLVETGCTYTSTPEDLVHTTTNNFAALAEHKGGILYSFDNEPSHIEYARTIIDKQGHVVFLCGNSVEEIKEWKSYAPFVDLVCFDSANDAEHTMAEYEAVKSHLCEKHYILVDDIHNPNAVKWKKLVPYLKELGYKGVEIPTPTGLFLTSKGYPLE